MADETGCTDNGSQSSKWRDSIRGRVNKMGNERPYCYIYKVPNLLRKGYGDDHSPRIVSIGPFHSSTTTRPTAEENDKWQSILSLLQKTLAHKQDHLLAMEKHKWWYVVYFSNRLHETTDADEILDQCSNAKTVADEILDQCSNAIFEEGEYVRRSYGENIKFDECELAEIMLVDGCFILELFLRSWVNDPTPEDPIFQNTWMVPTLRQDLALLENQIPFRILEKLFEIVVPRMPEYGSRGPPRSITDLALSFFLPDLVEEAIRKKCSQFSDNKHLHLLDLLHKFYSPTEGGKSSPAHDNCIPVECVFTVRWTKKFQQEEEKSRGFAKCATELSEAGFEFKEGNEGHLLNMTFNSGVITIPPLPTDKTTKSLLRSFIAFEQCLGRRGHHITWYAILLKSLIHSSLDIELLQKKKIISKDLGGIEDVLTLTNNISKEYVPENDYFIKLRKDVDEYQKSCCHWHRILAFFKVRCQRYYVVLKRDYFSTPWSFISFVAACAVIVLTAFQTYYAARADGRSD